MLTPAPVRNILNEFQFFLRSRFLGRVRLRAGLPTPVKSEKEIQFYLEILSRARVAKDMAWVVDVGCRNWSYANALATYFPNASLFGFEVDSYRRYWNLYRRLDMARAHAAELGNRATVIAGDFAQARPVLRGKGLFAFFYPFVSENPCLKWGLPHKFSNFAELLGHSKDLVTGETHWLSTHQGDWEVEEARKAYRESAIAVQETLLPVVETRELWPGQYDSWILSSGLEKEKFSDR